MEQRLYFTSAATRDVKIEFFVYSITETKKNDFYSIIVFLIALYRHTAIVI